MASASGLVGEIIKALEVAGSVALAVSLPDARVVETTRSLCRRWDCARADLVGQQFSQSRDGLLFARHIDADLSDVGNRSATRIDLTYRPRGRPAETLRFAPQLIRDGAEEYLLLVGSSRSQGRHARGEVEAWRLLATSVGERHAWDYDLAARQGETAPEIARLLGLDPAAASPSVLALDIRAHPDDAALTLSERLRELSDRTPLIRTRYRLRHEDGSWKMVEATAVLMKDPDNGQPSRIVGLLRETAEETSREVTPAAPQETPRAPILRSEAAERLTGDIARDFRLLLAGAHGNLRLAEEARDRDEVDARIRTVIEALERGVELANRLIDFSQEPPAEILPVHPAAAAPVPLPAIAESVPEPEEPAVPSPEPEAPAATSSPDPEPEAKAPAILIVEDNDQVRDVAVAMVEDLGYSVAGASSGPEALAILARRPDIRLLLSDVVMSGMMGPELAQQALAIRPGLKVLFASGYDGDMVEGVENIPEVVDLISKPFTREELSEKVRRAMAEALAA